MGVLHLHDLHGAVLHREDRGPGAVGTVGAAVELVVGAVALVAAAVVGVVFVHRPWPDRLDSWVDHQLGANYSSAWAHHVTALGSKPVLAIGVVVLFGVGLTRDWVRAVACAGAPLVAVVIVDKVAKPLVGHNATYPSGTVACVVALAVGAVLVAPKLAKVAMVAVGVVATVAVCIAVVVLRWHSPTDALGGLAVGVGTVLALDGGLHLAWSILHRTGLRPGAPDRSADGRRQATGNAPVA